MEDFTPTAEELAAEEKAAELNPKQKVQLEYEALIADKRTLGQLPCYEWRDDSCHCHEVKGSLHEGPIHTEREPVLWCAAHQSTECKEVHPMITFEQFLKRRLPDGYGE